MTVLLPWPSAACVGGPCAGERAQPPLSQTVAARRPLRSLHHAPAAALPPCGPAHSTSVGRLHLDLSSLVKLGPAVHRQTLSLRAGMAELVLLNRLRARTRRELCGQTLERATHILEVTARSWFGDGHGAPAAA